MQMALAHRKEHTMHKLLIFIIFSIFTLNASEQIELTRNKRKLEETDWENLF